LNISQSDSIKVIGHGPLQYKVFVLCGLVAFMDGYDIQTMAYVVPTLVNTLATNQNELLIYRFFTGIGLGASMPNIIALTVEYASERRRTMIITLVFCGLPLGGAAGGTIAPCIITKFG
jgi:MFS family permease